MSRVSAPPSSTPNPMLDHEYKQEDEDEERPKVNLKPTLIIILCALAGFAVGIGLSDGRGGKDIISWLKLPGDLFIRALKAVVLPLVFVNIILAVVDMIRAGKASAVAGKTIAIFALTTLLASLAGLLFVLMLRGAFSEKDVSDNTKKPEVLIKCPIDDLNGNERFLTEWADGSIRCMMLEEAILEEGQEPTFDTTKNTFLLNNTNNFLAINVDDSAPADDVTFSQTLQDGIFRKIISDNITNDFIQANFVGVITFAIVFGAASQALKRQPRVVVELLEESNRIFLMIVDWIIYLTPIAVFSLVAGNLGEQKELKDVFADIGVLMAASLLAMLFHCCVSYVLLFRYFVGEFPWKYTQFLFPMQIFAFASASSAASLPISLDCVAATKQVPSSIANFVLSMGSTLNMDGGALYFPAAVVFLAVAEGLESELDATAYFMIILLSSIGSAGAAPVPSASLVLILTAYNTVFDRTGTPDSFALILAIDWLMDRFRTLLNVTGNAYVARIVSALAGVTSDDDVLLNKAVEGERIRSINDGF